MHLLRYLIFRPLSLIYGAVVFIRNFMFDHRFLKSQKFPIPVICVGNITVGGTGKTPHVEYIASLLSDAMSTAVVSRGYMRSGKGFRIVSPDDKADITGDEPLQIAQRLQNVTVAVDADRADGIRRVMAMVPPVKAVVLDDGYQHRSVRAGLNILLTDYGRLMTRDYLMPYGRLRENIRGTSRADVIIITKTPADISPREKETISKEIAPLPHQHLFFTTLEYGKITPVFKSEVAESDNIITPETGILLITGIANPEPLMNYLNKMSVNIKHMSFRDHHKFSESDIRSICKEWEALEQKDKMIITTEKDSVRLKDFPNFTPPFKNELFYIPVRIKFIDNEGCFIKIITDYAGKNS